MEDKYAIMPAGEMREKYGLYYQNRPKIKLKKRRVPKKFWPLIPYAEFWGVADDIMRYDLVEASSPEERAELKNIVDEYDDLLEEWLTGDEADNPNPSDEYCAFSAMIMASDLCSCFPLE